MTDSTPLPPFDGRQVTGTVPLPQLGVIRALGPDAAAFLHGQLTQDFSLLGLSEARLAAFCSAKGRMLASFVGFKHSHEEIWLICSRDLLPATLKRLSMFVLRARVKLSDASDERVVHGLAGKAAAAVPPQPWSKLDTPDGAHWVRLYPGAAVPLALHVGPAGALAAHAQPGADTAALDPLLWAWLDVMSGVVTLTQPVVDAFVPQMLNYESIGGVNFKKGCYPGQEVVARSQFRGTLKRRGYLVHSSEPIGIGQEVYHESDAEQPCGTVASAAPHPGGGFSAMVSMQTSAAAGGRLQLGSASGPLLRLHTLPYPLLEDI
jgi:folate-binding protein YgfZ